MKRNMLNKIFIFFGIMFLTFSVSFRAYNQQTEIKIIDLSVMSKSKFAALDPVNIETQKKAVNDTLIVSFKINNIDKTKEINVQVGTTQGNDDIKKVICPVVFENNKYYIQGLITKSEIINYQTSILIELSVDEIKNAGFLSMYAVDNNGVQTQQLEKKLK